MVVRFEPWKAQEEAFLSIRENRLNLFLKARQIGITWVALMYCAHDLIYHPGHTVIALSKSKNDAQELVRRFGMILANMPSLLLGGEITFEVKKSEVVIHKDGKAGVFLRSFREAALPMRTSLYI